MTPGQINTIEAKASGVLEDVFGNLNDIQLPVSLSNVLDKYNIILKTGKFEDKNVSGVFNRKDQEIYVAEDEAPNRKAFTVAHELGHYFLHENKQTEVFLREQILNLTEESRENEQEANWFAASLLMPEKLIKKYYSISKDVDVLSTLFGVSPTAVYFRLKNLGLTA
ncbi:ImmA/IrrE family metallo-endopeptidase [Patescibacteria group bacterium]|nr:ImmA/IrrE family metallo-endopeptidase [Patescibacteria group bacterium]MBU4098446.1 ImmA/IrrE family metallo-endopeptidase [Patescibacteria group bacterium]